MKKFFFICLLINCYFSVSAEDDNFEYTKEDVSLKMLAVSAPNEINEIMYSQFNLEEPDYIRYSLIPVPYLGYIYTEDWLKLGISMPIASLSLLGVSQIGEDDKYWYAQRLLWMTGHHPPMLASYDVYKNLRSKVDKNQYDTVLKPIKIEDALIAPFDFTNLCDPSVAIGLACLITGPLVYNIISGNSYDAPSSDSITIKNNTYDLLEGNILYWSDALYTNYWAAVAEEAFYRGYVLPELIEYTGPIIGISLSSLLFAFVHYTPGKRFEDWALGYLPFSIFHNILSYKNDYDFRKGIFVHFWYDMFLYALYYPIWEYSANQQNVDGKSYEITFTYSFSF